MIIRQATRGRLLVIILTQIVHRFVIVVGYRNLNILSQGVRDANTIQPGKNG